MRRDALNKYRLTGEVPDEYAVVTRRPVKRHRNRHHLVPKSRKGPNTRRNLLYIDVNVHRRWHLVFGNRTLDEVIALLERVRSAKQHQSV
jgi:hypothetical protein